jgi:hypothetical protein
VSRVVLHGGDEILEVVGESYRQEALWGLVGGLTHEVVRHPIQAVLRPEPMNAYDHNAVAVDIQGHHVGYLAAHEAEQYGPGLRVLMDRDGGSYVALRGVICGGGDRPEGRGMLGVFLDHDPTVFGVPSFKQAGRGPQIRTGLTETAGLAWLDDLSQNEPTAIIQLRNLLASASDPTERHYLFAELEKRLYRTGFTYAAALDEFDQVTAQHDREMGTICEALRQRLGVIPLLEVYRQVAIRQTRVRNWEAVRHCCDRGLYFYGPNPYRPEFADDLAKRREKALAKLEAASRPPAVQPAGTKPGAYGGEAVMEQLLCAACGASFERVRTRGRKPMTCPACR